MKNIYRLAVAVFVFACFMSIAAECRSDTSYYRELADRKVTFLSDGCYTACILLGVADKYSNFESQKKFLIEQGVLSERFKNARANTLLRKGVAAHMFCKALDIKGGVMLHVFGASEKYALRELVYKELVTEGPEQDIVTGKELLSILMRASEYKNKK